MRIDQWVWAVRLYKTRSQATAACRGGHVRLNGSAVKAATRVRVGDRVHVRAGGRQWDLEVERLVDKRVGAPVAATCYTDHSPPPPPEQTEPRAMFAVRDRGSGRPTKRERRQIDRLRGRR